MSFLLFQHEDTIIPFLEILSSSRDQIRLHARKLKASDILKECDRLRDEVLPNLGVKFEDEEGASAAVKMYDREELLKELELKKKLEAEKAAEKERKKAEAAEQAAAKDAKWRIPPEEIFKLETDKYSKFDDKVSDLKKCSIKQKVSISFLKKSKYLTWLTVIKIECFKKNVYRLRSLNFFLFINFF